MAKRASIATGNFTAAGTWGLIDATMYGQSETSQPVCATSYGTATRSALYTPGAITVSHIGIKLANRTGTTGTITVHIANNAHVEVAGTAVTINCADLPAATNTGLNGGWHFFKLATPVTLAAATQYEVEAKTSSASQIQLHASATTNGLSCALLDAATTGAPAAGDDLFVVGEYTGTGTSNSFTVTMDNTATTDFGSAPTAANSLLGPGIAICNKGTLTFGSTAATNYYLKVSNSVIVYSGGTFNIGTTGTPIPRDSTAVLEFDPAADGDYGLVVRNLGTFNAQGLSRTSGKDVVMCKLNTDEAAGQTTLGVDTDTGWLNGDDIVITSTTQTSTQGEKRTLNANANASDMTVSAGLTNAHSGTSPTQAEVLLLTRNVKIRSATSTLMAYVYCAPTSQVDIDWVEFSYLGENATNKRGIEVATTTGSFNMQYSTIRDCEDGMVYTSSASLNNLTISNNVFYNLTLSGIAFYITVATSGTSLTITNNYFATITGTGISLYDCGGTFTGNVVTGCSGAGVSFNESNASYGTVQNNTVHSCGSYGFILNSAATGSFIGTSDTIRTLSSFTIWRCVSGGFFTNSQAGSLMRNMVIDGFIFFGNGGRSIRLANPGGGAGTGAQYSNVVLTNITSNGDSTFATTNGIEFGDNSASAPGYIIYENLRIINNDFSTVSGIKTAHTVDLEFTYPSISHCSIYVENTKLGAATEVASGDYTALPKGSFIRFQKNDQTAGLHKTFSRYGTIIRETTTVHTGSQSFKMTPANATYKLESNSFYIAVANGATLTPSVYVYEDASYNGARARLILKRNDAIGITSDTVIDTATASSDGAWEELTGTTDAATDDGVMEFIIDCDGTAGNLFVDSFTVA